MKPDIKLKWQRVDHTCDLQATNARKVYAARIKDLLHKVEMTESWGRHFSKPAAQEFERWLRENMSTPLQEQAYARLSNWFLSGLTYIPPSPLGEACQHFWDALFCARPERRLTDLRRNHRILPERFQLWWSKQVQSQQER